MKKTLVLLFCFFSMICIGQIGLASECKGAYEFSELPYGSTMEECSAFFQEQYGCALEVEMVSNEFGAYKMLSKQSDYIEFLGYRASVQLDFYLEKLTHVILHLEIQSNTSELAEPVASIILNQYLCLVSKAEEQYGKPTHGIIGIIPNDQELKQYHYPIRDGIRDVESMLRLLDEEPADITGVGLQDYFGNIIFHIWRYKSDPNWRIGVFFVAPELFSTMDLSITPFEGLDGLY